MREETIKIYTFEELSDGAKEVARGWWKKCLDEDFSPYAEIITEDFGSRLEELGYPTDDINWSLSHSQGDGVAFYGTVNRDMMETIVRRFYSEGDMTNEEFELYNNIIENDLTVFGAISRNSFGHHYSHWNTMSVEIDSDNIDTMVEELFGLEYSGDGEFQDRYDEIDMMISRIESFISSEIKEISRDLENDGYLEIEYRYSDEIIDETLIINEYEFTEDGKIY